MTRRIPSPRDEQHLTQHPRDVIATPMERAAPRGLSGWWLGLLALLPVACCALPLLVAAGVTAGSGVVLGGLTGGVLMLTGATVVGLWVMRRSRTRATGSSATSPSRDRCC